MQNAVVTGASRRAGIAAAVANRLRRDGWRVFTSGWKPYDAEMPWGADPEQRVDCELDLSIEGSPKLLMDAAAEAHGVTTGLVIAHTVDVPEPLASLSPEGVDRHLLTNVRATLLLMKEFSSRLDAERGGRVVLFTSGLAHPGSIAYAASKSAMRGIVATASAELASKGIIVNAIDPGPVQTGWMNPETEAAIAARSPAGRVSQPSDAAKVVSFLMSTGGAWITGQTIVLQDA